MKTKKRKVLTALDTNKIGKAKNINQTHPQLIQRIKIK